VQPGQVTVPGDGGKVTVKVTVRISTAENDFTASGFKLYYGEQEVADLGSAGITSSDAEPLKAEFNVELAAQDIGLEQTVYAQYSFAYGQDSDMTQTARHEAGRFTVTEKPADTYLLVLEPDNTIVENGGTVNFNGTFNIYSTLNHHFFYFFNGILASTSLAYKHATIFNKICATAHLTCYLFHFLFLLFFYNST
ncbi:MAG: hypothetical protein Q4E94_06110, partial [Clostridia bacterium]|nr:hypothetical protein [Clostridia bacterium]